MSSTSAALTYNLPGHVDLEVPTTVSGMDRIVAPWVAARIGLPAESFDPCTCIGVVLGGKLVAGVVFNNYHPYPQGAVIEASIAASTPRWCTRTVLRDCFSYPFVQLGVTRMQVTCLKSNKHGRKFVEKLGFKIEGVARRMWSGAHDAAVYSMLPQECRWTNG